MKSLFVICWWGVYIIGAVILQRFLPAVDALAPGFLFALQEKRPWQTFWLFVIFVLIQDGSGSLIFGSAVLWYGGQIALFRMLRSLVVSETVIFVLVLSLCLGVYHGLLTLLMCSVQNIPPHYSMIMRESLVQALVIPLLWGLIRALRPRFAPDGARP